MSEKRQRWKYADAAIAYREAHGNPPYTMLWNRRLETIYSSSLPVVARLMAFIDRMANGNLSDAVVDDMPALKPGDRIPKQYTQAEIAEIFGVSQAAISYAARAMRDAKILLEEDPETPGVLYTGHCLDGDLFAEASQRSHAEVSPLVSPGTPKNIRESERTPPDYSAFKKLFLDAHPLLRDKQEELKRQRDELKERAKRISDDIEAVNRVVLANWRMYKREREKAGANSDSAGPTPDPVQDVYSDSSGVNQQVVNSLHPESDHNSPVFSEGEKETYIIGEQSLRRRRLDGSDTEGATPAAASATTTPVQTPRTEPEGVEQSSAQTITVDEFHAALASEFQAVRKPVPTPKQSAACFENLAGVASDFLDWMIRNRKSQDVRHPGILPSLVAEFHTERTTAARRAQPAAPDPAQEEAASLARVKAWYLELDDAGRAEYWKVLAETDRAWLVENCPEARQDRAKAVGGES